MSQGIEGGRELSEDTERAASRGRFVVVVGPDGVGKTTVARTLIDRFQGPTAYVHFRPRLFGSLKERPSVDSSPPPAWGKNDPSALDVLLGWLRLARSWGHFWIGYLFKVRPAVRRGCLVVADRWGYGYGVQPRALKFYGPRWLGAAAVRALPRPDLVAVLSTDAQRVFERKGQLTLGTIAAEQEAWRQFQLHPAARFDAAGSANDVAQAIERWLWA